MRAHLPIPGPLWSSHEGGSTPPVGANLDHTETQGWSHKLHIMKGDFHHASWHVHPRVPDGPMLMGLYALAHAYCLLYTLLSGCCGCFGMQRGCVEQPSPLVMRLLWHVGG